MPLHCATRQPADHLRLLQIATTPTESSNEAALRKLQRSDNPFLLAASAWAVGQRHVDLAVPDLVRLLTHSSHIVRVYAAEALLKLNASRDEIVPVLLEVISAEVTLRENRFAKWRAIRLIEEMKPPDQSLLKIAREFREQWKRDLSSRAFFQVDRFDEYTDGL